MKTIGESIAFIALVAVIVLTVLVFSWTLPIIVVFVILWEEIIFVVAWALGVPIKIGNKSYRWFSRK